MENKPISKISTRDMVFHSLRLPSISDGIIIRRYFRSVTGENLFPLPVSR